MKSLALIFGMVTVAILTGCTTTTTGPSKIIPNYPAVEDGGFKVPAIAQGQIAKEYSRQIVDYSTKEKPGTIVVDTNAHFLYFVMDDGKAMRYGIGVGRDGFRWSGNAYVGRKAEWPSWTPPQRMLKRQPELREFAGGMKPGLKNPLGARALYLYKNGKDSLYRLHGTPEWWTIGTNVSSGCVRLINQDIIDLYSRAKTGARVVVF